jgi:hypothetical protein
MGLLLVEAVARDGKLFVSNVLLHFVVLKNVH